MKIVVDTNIVFSALLNSSNTIGDILFNSFDKFEFYCPNYLRYEIKKHWLKLLKISKLNENELETSFQLVTSKIHFISEEIINKEIWLESEKLVEKIDIDDIAFVALTIFLEGKLWSGDKVLIEGLKTNGFKNTYTTSEIILERG